MPDSKLCVVGWGRGGEGVEALIWARESVGVDTVWWVFKCRGQPRDLLVKADNSVVGSKPGHTKS